MFLVRLFCLSLVVAFAIANPWTPEPRPEEWCRNKHILLANRTQHHGSEIEVVFLGDDYIQYWGSNGITTWDTYYASRNASNYGISGDRTENVIWRIENGEFDKLTPKLVVLMIGYNNIKSLNDPLDIANGVETILQKLQQKMPKTKIMLLSVLPINSVLLDTMAHELNNLTARIADNKVVFYHDLTSAFETSVGIQKTDVWQTDNFHVKDEGYLTWYNQTEPIFSKLYNSSVVGDDEL